MNINTASTHRCAFCGMSGDPSILTYEHLLSGPVLRLMGGDRQTDVVVIGDPGRLPELNNAQTVEDLRVRAVCAACNNDWMSILDNRFARAVQFWTGVGTAKLGRDHLHVVRRFLTKLVWVASVGEVWTNPDWLTNNNAPVPPFIPLNLIDDGQSIATNQTDQLDAHAFVGATRIPTRSQPGFTLSQITMDGSSHASRVAALVVALAINLPKVRLRLHIILSPVSSGWTPDWPYEVAELTDRSKFNDLPKLAAMGMDQLTRQTLPRLVYTGTGAVPDIDDLLGQALNRLVAVAPKVNRPGSHSDSGV